MSLTIDEAEALRELKDFASSGKYPGVTVPRGLFMKLVERYESDAPDRAIFVVTGALARLAVSRGWSGAELRRAFEGAYTEAIGEAGGARVVSAHGSSHSRDLARAARVRADAAILAGLEATSKLSHAVIEESLDFSEADDG